MTQMEKKHNEREVKTKQKTMTQTEREGEKPHKKTPQGQKWRKN